MRMIVLSDIHGDTDNIEMMGGRFSMADYIMLSGDITHFGREPEVKTIVNKIKKYSGNILAIPGNCDHHEVNRYLIEKDYSIDSRYKILHNYFVMGLGGSLPCPGKTPNEHSEEEFMVALEETVKFNENGLPLILMTHHPPFNTNNDKLSDGFHVGSHSIRVFIEKYQPLVCFCGHIHESTGIDKIGKSIIINPGSFNMGKFTNALIQNSEVKAEILNLFTF